ncbi:MAG: CPBP family glutamic-type intramembrane protease [Aeromicrobium sp.]
MGAAAKWVRARPVVAFFLLTFAITYVCWVPMMASERGWFEFDLPLLFFVGGLGPGIAAFIVMRILRGSDADQALFGPLLRWRVGVWWYLVALLLFVVIWLIATTVAGDLDEELTALGPWIAFLAAVVVYTLAAVPEEVGWRGFAVPALQVKHSALVAGLVVGVAWWLWHLPLLLGGNEAMSEYPLLPHFVYVVSASVLYVWLYNNTGGSLLIAVLAHAVSNIVGVFSSAPVATAVIIAGVAAAVVVVYGPANLSRTKNRVTSTVTQPVAALREVGDHRTEHQ